MARGVKIEGSYNCCLNFAWHYNSKYWIRILPLVFWPPYPWYFDHPYPWYIDPPPMVFWPPTHGILTLYLWYIEPFTHGIPTPISMVFWPPTHGISTHYPWYIDPPTHGISTAYTLYIKPSLLVEMRRVSLPWGGSRYNDEKSTLGSKHHMTPVILYRGKFLWGKHFAVFV
jgi:hypothetical protein